jgi:hypothetical protein
MVKISTGTEAINDVVPSWYPNPVWAFANPQIHRLQPKLLKSPVREHAIPATFVLLEEGDSRNVNLKKRSQARLKTVASVFTECCLMNGLH